MISLEEKAQLVRLEEAIDFKRSRIRRFEVIAKKRESDFWKALKQDIEATLKGLRTNLDMLAQGYAVPGAERDDFRSLSRFYGGQILALEGVVFNVDKAQDKIDRINEEIGRHMEESKGIRAQLGQDKPSSREVIV